MKFQENLKFLKILGLNLKIKDNSPIFPSKTTSITIHLECLSAFFTEVFILQRTYLA